MEFLKKNKKRFIIGTCLALFVGVFVVSSVFSVRPALAQDADPAEVSATIIRGVPGNPLTTDIPAASSDVIMMTNKNLIKKPLRIVLKNVLINLLSTVINRLAYDAATFMAAGASGQQPSFQYKSAEAYFEDLGLDIVGFHLDALNEFISEGGVYFDVCIPQDPFVILALQLGIRSAYDRPEPDCTVTDLWDNWKGEVSSIINRYKPQGENPQSYLLEQFKQIYNPGQNELSATIGLSINVHDQAMQAKWLGMTEMLSKDGYNDVVNMITGNVETPASLIEHKTEDAIVESKNREAEMNWDAIITDQEIFTQMGLSAASVFLNTFLSEFLQNIYDGLWDVDIVEADPFSGELANIPGRSAAEEKYRDMLSVEVISLDTFSPITELMACPGATSRSLFNCAIDSNLATALSQSETGNPMTVQEALDEGLLSGGWPLIPSSDYARNQDPYCYTYGYCYGNMVKLRRFRVIPVGWEMAANSSYNSGDNPITLQEVVDDFYDCNDDGEIDSSHPWCHLIDPNWVLKAPETSCPAVAPGELLASTGTNIRHSYCMDTPSCIAEDDQGNCIGGEGYCVREKNIWRFRGDDCPEQYSSCLSFQNIDTGETGDWLLNTAEYDSCNADNAGCRWYRTNKYFDDLGTDDYDDDEYAWLAGDEEYLTEGRDADVLTSQSSPTTYEYDTDDDGTDDYSYAIYAYEDRRYFNNDVAECSEDEVGCTELITKTDTVFLNAVANPSFEDDDDENGLPDLWWGITEDEYYDDQGDTAYGLDHVVTDTSSDFYQEILLPANRFYTYSFFAAQVDGSSAGSVGMSLYDLDGNEADLSGLTYLGDCELVGGNNNRLRVQLSDPGEDYIRYSCTFTTPAYDTMARLRVRISSGELRFDAFQLEEGSVLNDFQTGYGASYITYNYLQVPPNYLGCTGAETDPNECDDYAPMCSSLDVGCELYTPEDGDPAVPAIISELDECPFECVGYDTYKQEATTYDDEDFPLYFIPDTADSCEESSVGCDEFTNLNTVDAGGEGLEYYTYLRMCSPADDLDDDDWSTFYTWEGSDQDGYQLVSWNLLESNLGGATDDLFYSGVEEVNVGAAPCVNPRLSDETTLECDDVGYENDDNDSGWEAIRRVEDCDEHDDIFDNPDCREFYDGDGNIHYRQFSDTATITDDCAPYRKSESEEDDCDMSGGYWTESGECRYLGYIDESTECSSISNGCRSYTGGAGRNASTIFSDDVEDDSLEEWSGTSSDATVSNESVAVGGHSIHVTTGTLDTLYLDEDDLTQACEDGTMCTIEDLGGSNCDVTGTDDLDYCGSLVNGLVVGKTYIVSFWAKGIGDLEASLIDDTGNGDVHDFEASAITLSSSWELYEMGPLDTTGFEDFDDTAILRFEGTDEFYIDNIILKEAEDNITLIKDSWVTPSTCDQTPEEVESEQYYLGCEAYMDRAGDDFYLYQFSQLCSESVVGCEAYYDTQNSEGVYPQVYNVACNAVDVNDVSLFAGDVGVCSNDSSITCDLDDDCDDPGECVAATATSCVMTDDLGNSTTVCTIAVGQNECFFDWNGNLPSTLPDNISLGPEAVVVPNDVGVYLIDAGDGTYDCNSAYVGCTEFGNPTFDQTQSEVTEFESVYFLDLPDEYSSQLCEHEELFCAAWSTNEDGNFYFKDPEEKLCEYKSSVTLNSRDYYGWFRANTEDPCYFDDEDGDGAFDPTNEVEYASVYLISGEEIGMWRNGDSEYDGWVGECDSQYDRCAEFVDVMDTNEGENVDGTSYYFLKNEKISEDELPDSQKCSGEASLREGCVLFNDYTDSGLDWNASASYVLSEHADVVMGDAPFSPQTPVDCSTDEGGIYTLVDGTQVDLCWNRCQYASWDRNGYVDYYYGSGSCLVDADCPGYEINSEYVLSGSCLTYTSENEITETCIADETCPSSKLTNDVNTIQRVYRDRECAEWLTCRSGGFSWDQRTNSWKNICTQITSCDEYSAQGDASFCTGFPQNDFELLSDATYSTRDVSWYGQDYSGYSIPETIPAEFLNEYNINPAGWCVDSYTREIDYNEVDGILWPQTCDGDDDCGSGEECESADADYRLAYNTGSCTANIGSPCTMGTCDNGLSCQSLLDCDGTCFKGYCTQTRQNATCVDNGDCSSWSGYECRGGLCVNETSEQCGSDGECNDGEANVVYSCEIVDSVLEGHCVNNKCLVDQFGHPFNPNTAEETMCRGYPEITSPYPHEVVTEWKDPETDEVAEFDDFGYVDWDRLPYNTRYGYEQVNVCGPVDEDCLCTYNKATYGGGAITRYFEYDREETEGQVRAGVCLGGANDGWTCSDDTNCGDSGVCMMRDGYDAYIGWEGICLERDTSINLWGNPDGPGVCLTWMPVDQLKGATDIYAKSEEAGFPLGEAYYCTEAAYYYDLYPTGAQFDEDGNVTDIEVACAESYGSDDGSIIHAEEGDIGLNNDCGQEDGVNEYASCWYNAYCPTGYFAVVGYCYNTSHPEYTIECSGDENLGGYIQFFKDDDNDCPYFCVPKGAYRLSDGESCDELIEDYSRPEDYINSLAAADVRDYNAYSVSDQSRWGTDVYLAGHLVAGNGSDVDTFKDCVRRGVPIDGFGNGINTLGYYNYDWDQDWSGHYATDNIDVWGIDNCGGLGGHYFPDEADDRYDKYDWRRDCDHAFGGIGYDDDGHEDAGYYHLDVSDVNELPGQGSVIEYIGCDTLVKTATGDENKAWTQRLLHEPNEYAFQDPDPHNWSDPFDYDLDGVIDEWASLYYDRDTYPSYAGQVLLDTYYASSGSGDTLTFNLKSQNDVVSAPLPVATCSSGLQQAGRMSTGLSVKHWPEVNCLQGIWDYPNEAQFEDIVDTHVNQIAVSYEDLDHTDEQAVFDDYLGSGDLIWDAELGSSFFDADLSIGQFFAKSYEELFWDWDHYGEYVGGAYSASDDDYIGVDASFDITGDTPIANQYGDADFYADNPEYDGIISPPVVMSMGYCMDDLCREGSEGKFEVNGADDENVYGAGGNLHAFLQFFATTDPNQFPIKNVHVKWGDDDEFMEGSISTDNFYKARRGIKENQYSETECDESEWGRTSNSCQESYFAYMHDYVCAQDDIDTGLLPLCEIETVVIDGDTRLIVANSPCTGGDADTYILESSGKCIFQPRVLVKDNWGYCTGVCSGDPGGDFCYDDSDGDTTWDECDTDCPTAQMGAGCEKGEENPGDIYNAANPWVYYDGAIVVEP